MDASKIFIYSGSSVELDLEAGLGRLKNEANTANLEPVDVKARIVTALEIFINLSANPSTAKKEINNLVDSAGRSGIEAMVLVGASTIIEMYGEGNFETSFSNNLDVIKSIKASFEGSVSEAPTPRSGPTTPSKSAGESASKQSTPKTPKVEPGSPQYLEEGSSFGNIVIGGPPPYRFS